MRASSEFLNEKACAAIFKLVVQRRIVWWQLSAFN